MGSGKSTLGKKIANILDLPFFDIDLLIEADQKKSISEIFNNQGEGYFRQLESKYLRDLNSSGVYATGGGIIEKNTNCRILTEKADLIIWLETDWQTILERIRTSKRPLVKIYTEKQLFDLYIHRSGIYKKLADIIFNGNNLKKLLQTIENKKTIF